MSDGDMLPIARWLVHERGFSVFPLDHPDATRYPDDPKKIGKVPIAPWLAFQVARPTDDNLASWFGNGTPRNLAIVTGALSGVVAIDCDSSDAEAWADANLPATPMVTRTAKGSHRFYRHPGALVPTKARIHGGGLALDVRGDGGYVVAPGSVHQTGFVYARVGPWPPVTELPPFDVAWLAPATPDPKPATKARLIEASPGADRDRLLARARAYIASVPGAVEGQGGDQHTYVTACRLVRDFGLDRGDALMVLAEWNQRCSPPWSDRDLEAKIDGALKYGDGPIGSKTTQDRPRRSSAQYSPAASPDAPAKATIKATDQDLPRVTAAAIAALGEWNNPPTLFRYGGMPMRLEADDDEAPLVHQVDENRLRHALAHAATWWRPTKQGEKVPALPPIAVVRNVLAAPATDLKLPVLMRIIEAPVFARGGRLHQTPGYLASSRLFYAPAAGFTVPPVSMGPSASEIARARGLLLDDLLVDFPFTGDSERAHALVVVLLPFLRELIEGPTPLHLIEKPTPGTGATLLQQVAIWPALGRDLAVMTEGTDEESWRKRVTSTLRTSPTAISIDNLRRRLDSAAVSSAITATTWEDRMLGKSENVRLPVRCVWLATANNPALSNEIARRTIRIRLDARIDRPWLRSGFRHDPLGAWVRQHRADLVWAALTLGQAWIAAGCPPGAQTMGQFEAWARVMGGVLSVADVPGFLQNLDAFYDSADTESAGWRGLVERWAERYQRAAVGVSDLWVLVAPDPGSGLEPLAFDFLDDPKLTDRSLRIRFGKRLAAQRDRIFGEYRIEAADRKQGVAQWRVVPIGSRVM